MSSFNNGGRCEHDKHVPSVGFDIEEQCAVCAYRVAILLVMAIEEGPYQPEINLGESGFFVALFQSVTQGLAAMWQVGIGYH